eukprot:COSAG06_NODE_49730_length_323_cov_0.919643_2_plen_24_part_01
MPPFRLHSAALALLLLAACPALPS